MLNNKQIDFLVDNFSHIMVSYDGLPDVQNRNRQAPNACATNDVVENTIVEISKRGVPITVRTTFWEDDFPKILEMYEHVFSLLSENTSSKWSIYPTLSEGRAIKQMKNNGENLYGEFLRYYVTLVEHIISTQGEEQLGKIEAPIFNNDLCELFCGAHRGINPWLLPDKSIVTCIESSVNKTRIGKVDDNTVEYYHEYTDDLLRITQKKYTQCRGCIAYRFCRGGCPVWDLRKTSQNSTALECIAQKEYWRFLIQAALSGKYSFGWRLEPVIFPGYPDSEIYKLTKVVD